MLNLNEAQTGQKHDITLLPSAGSPSHGRHTTEGSRYGNKSEKEKEKKNLILKGQFTKNSTFLFFGISLGSLCQFVQRELLIMLLLYLERSELTTLL